MARPTRALDEMLDEFEDASMELYELQKKTQALQLKLARACRVLNQHIENINSQRQNDD